MFQTYNIESIKCLQVKTHFVVKYRQEKKASTGWYLVGTGLKYSQKPIYEIIDGGTAEFVKLPKLVNNKVILDKENSNFRTVTAEGIDATKIYRVTFSKNLKTLKKPLEEVKIRLHADYMYPPDSNKPFTFGFTGANPNKTEFLNNLTRIKSATPIGMAIIEENFELQKTIIENGLYITNNIYSMDYIPVREWSPVFTQNYFDEFDEPESIPEISCFVYPFKINEFSNISYNDPSFTPPSSKIIYPYHEIVDGDYKTNIIWQHTQEADFPQTEYQLQYKLGDNWVDIAVAKGENNQIFVKEEFFSPGKNQIRIRTRAEFTEYGPWFVSEFEVRSRPIKPIITEISDSAKPEISWHSEGQIGYQLEILQKENIIFDSKVIYSVLTRFKYQSFLDIGTYQVRIKIVNEYGRWSDYDMKEFNITQTSLESIDIEAYPSVNKVRIFISHKENIFDMYKIFRNNVLIKTIDEIGYVDYFPNIDGQYYVIGYKKGEENYKKSNIVDVKIDIENTFIKSIVTPKEGIELKINRGSKPVKNRTHNILNQPVHYVGRRYPVIEVSEFEDKKFSFNYSLRNKKEFNKLKEFFEYKQICFLLEPSGERHFGFIDSINDTWDNISTDFSFNFLVCDYKEGEIPDAYYT